MVEERYDSDDTTIVGAKDAAEQPRDNPAGEATGGSEPSGTVLTLVCEKCGGTVFRSFHETVGDEASDDFRDSTERDLDPDDAEGDVMPGDIMDLNRL